MLAQSSCAIQILGLPAASVTSFRELGGSFTRRRPSSLMDTQRQHGKASGSVGRGPSLRVTEILGSALGSVDDEDVALDIEGVALTLTRLGLGASSDPSDLRFRDGGFEGNGRALSCTSCLTVSLLAASFGNTFFGREDLGGGGVEGLMAMSARSSSRS